MNALPITAARLTRAFCVAIALLVLAAAAGPARLEAQSQSACTLAASPHSFEPNPPGATRPGSLAATHSSALVLFKNAAGAPRMMMNETFGYSILDLTNPTSPYALKYDDVRQYQGDVNYLVQSGDGQSAIQTFGVSPDGQRAAISVNGPFGAWNTLAAKSDGGDGFILEADFPPSRASGTVVQAIGGRYIAYATQGSSNMTASDITSLPASGPGAVPSLNIPYDTTGFPAAFGPPLLLVGNYLVYRSGTYPNPVITVIDASNPGSQGSIASGFKSVGIGSLPGDSFHRAPANFTAALDPGDPTKVWVLVEVSAATGETSPSYGLVAVTGAGSGSLTVTAAAGLFKLPAAPLESWQNAGFASSLVAQNGNLFAVMWAQRSSPSFELGFYATTASAWLQSPPVSLPFQQVSASGFGLPATNASALSTGAVAPAANVFQYFPAGNSAFAIPLACAPVNQKATSTITVTNSSILDNPAIPNGGTAWIGDFVTITPAVVPPPSQVPLTGFGWNVDVDFHAGATAEDNGSGATPRIKQPDNAAVGASSTPAAFSIYGPCDPAYTGTSVNPSTGTGCWTSVTSNGSNTATGQPDFSASAPVAKPLVIAMEANNQYGSTGTSTFTINWQVPAAKVQSTQILLGASMVDASDGHPSQTGFKWYFGDTPTTLSAACTNPSCPPTNGNVGTHYYWLTATYRGGFSTPDYVQGTTNGLPFTITPFVPAFTVGGSAIGPITALIGSNVNVVNNSQRGGVSATYQYSLCTPATSCLDNYLPFNIGDTPGALSSISLPSTVGTYALKLKASYTGGASGTAYWPDPAGTNYFTINAVNIPVTTASVSPSSVPSGTQVTLGCSAVGGATPYTQWAWYIDGSLVTTQATPSYPYTAVNPGATDITDSVTCTAKDSNSQTSAQSLPVNLTIQHSVKPVVSVSVNPTTIVGGNSATFTCSATGGSGTYTLYQWSTSFGIIPGQSQSTYGVTINNTSGSTITQQVWCSVTDSAGATGSSPTPATLTITSSTSGPPSGSISVSAYASPNPVAAGSPTVFSCSASGGSGSYTYAWVPAFGSAVSTQQNYTYTPPAAGALSLTCLATDTSNSKTGQYTVNLTVVAAGPSCPSVDFKVYSSNGTQLIATQSPFGATIPMAAALGDNLGFSISSGVAAQFDWNFGDGTAHKTGPVSDATVTYARHAFMSGGTFTATLRPICSDGTTWGTGMSYPITVSGPTASFSASYEDATPITYTQVTAYKNIVFTALDSASLVDAGSYAWDFGDGATASGLPTETHAYIPGTWTAKLTVTKGGVPVSSTLALTVPAPPEPPKWVVPGMAYVFGQVAGTTWQSDVTIMNPSSTLTAKYSVAFLDARAPVADYSELAWTTISVPPLNVIESPNLLAGQPFNQAIGAYGALMVRGDVAPLPPVITARTFNAGDPTKGTFGLSVPQSSVSAGVSTQAAAAASALIGLRQNDSAYTNIGLVNLHNDWATVEMDFFDGLSAADLGTLTVQINPYQSYQINKALLDGRFVPAAGYSTSSNLYSVLVKVRQGTGVYPYATVIDLGTTDPIVVTPTAAPSNSYRIPGVVRLTGANGELWRSRVTITNPSTASRKVHTVFYYQACDATGCSSLNSTAGDVTFAPGQTQAWDDFVNVWLTHFGHIAVSDTTSYQNTFLDVSPGDTDSDPLVVLGETYNATPAGHVGLQITGYTPLDGASHSGAYKRLVLTGLSQSSAYRTNVALLVLAGATGKWVTVHVLSPQGTDLHQVPVFVDGFSQVSASTLFNGVPGDLSRVSILVDNLDDGVTIGAYATIIDNTSGDATFVKATPVP